VVGPNFRELWVSIGNFKGDYKKAREQIEKTVMARQPGFQYEPASPYLQETHQGGCSAATGAQRGGFCLRTYGPDLAKLRDPGPPGSSRPLRAGPDGQGGRRRRFWERRVSRYWSPNSKCASIPTGRAEGWGLTPADVFDFGEKTLLNGRHVGENPQGPARPSR